MVGGGDRKQAYFTRLLALFDEMPCALLVTADNVGSAHMQRIRKELRGFNATLLMGKNTMIRKALRGHLSANPKVEAVLPFVVGNIGFVFCTHDTIGDVAKLIKENRVGAAAKAGMIAPVDVTVSAGPTGMEPTQTSFLQALNIATKINRGQIEIVKDVELIKAGDKVGNSEAALLAKLEIRPFSYGLEVVQVYDEGAMMSPKLLSITEADVLARFAGGVRNVAALSLAANYPTLASVPHSLMNGYKNVLAVSVATDYTYEQSAALKERLANPEAFAAPAAAAAPAPAASGGGDKAAAKEVEKEESEEEDMGFGLFD